MGLNEIFDWVPFRTLFILSDLPDADALLGVLNSSQAVRRKNHLFRRAFRVAQHLILVSSRHRQLRVIFRTNLLLRKKTLLSVLVSPTHQRLSAKLFEGTPLPFDGGPIARLFSSCHWIT